MDIDEATKLVNKSMKVILSCEILSQLNNAIKYADFVYKKISREIGLINNT